MVKPCYNSQPDTMLSTSLRMRMNKALKVNRVMHRGKLFPKPPTSHYIIRHCLENIQHSRQQHSKNTADNTNVIPNQIKTTPQTKKTSPKTRKNPKNKTFQKLEHRKHN
jgi:NADH:ubiquinone oxidoreductase subunit D